LQVNPGMRVTAVVTEKQTSDQSECAQENQ
jgi:hypothetical protein